VFNQIYDLADRFGVIDTIANTVRSQPGKAAASSPTSSPKW
jgi:hypothetical protein